MIPSKYYSKKFSISKLLIFLILCYSISISQTANNLKYSETGQPFIKYFGPRTYNASADNWTIVQDKRGVMYFGNGTGILEFDGNTWRKIQVPNSSNVRSLALADDGTIYVCASNDFGYLQPDSIGQLRYRSLKPYLDKKHQSFGEMWDVAISSAGIFFKTKDKIFRWNGRSISVIDSVNAFRLYKIKDTIYSRNNTIGLMQIEGDSLKLMPDGSFFASTGVFDMLPFKDKHSIQNDKILITTNYKGLFIHDGKKFAPFKTEIDSFLIKNQIYNSCITANGNFAFATQRGGVAIVDQKGHLVRIIDEDSGLPTNVVYDIYSDRQGGLWLATLYGIVYCEATSPFSVFENRGALKNMSSAVIRFEGKIYVANELGVLYLSDEKSTFELIEGSTKPAYSFLNTRGVLFAATNWGVVKIEKKRFGEFLMHETTNKVIASKVFSGRIYAVHRNGLAVIQEQKKNQFSVVFSKETEDEVLSVVEDKDGSLWLAGYFPGIFHISGNIKDLADGSDENVTYKFYDKKNGLPGNMWGIYDIQDQMLLSTDGGVFRFDKESQKFLPDSTLGNYLSNANTNLSLIAKGRNNNLWIVAERDGIYDLGEAIQQKDSRYKWEPIPEFRRLELSTAGSIYSDYDAASDDEILWISTNEALIRYDPDRRRNIETNYQTLIRKVSFQNDSVIYGGTSATTQNSKKIILPSDKNDVSFEFSALTFDKPEATLYQYYLDGDDDDWSNWTSESKKEYTNLSGGDYKFFVRSKNVYGVTGMEDVFYFTVLSPWYFSWWAYITYIMIIIFLIFIVDRIQRRRVTYKEQEKSKLREAELIKKQAEELETVDKLVRGINKADDLESLFNSLLEQTISFIPNAEKAAIFLLDQEEDQFRVAYTSGYKIDDLNNILFLPEELETRYTKNSDEIEKGIYIVSRTGNLPGDEKLRAFKKPKSMLVMAVEWENRLEAYVVFDNFSNKTAFDPSAARILSRFREHAVSAISKARSLKMLQDKNEKIIKTQEQLLMQEKLASLGQLTAGIAHEIKNPLNFVKNFAEISVELMQELRDNLLQQKEKLNTASWEEIQELIQTLEDNSNRINEHGKRADSIVRSMLQHSRGKSGERRRTDINAMLDENINLVYHGFKAQDVTCNIKIEKDFDLSVGEQEVVPQDLSRVLLNIMQNAFYAAMYPMHKDPQEDILNPEGFLKPYSNEHHDLKKEPTIRVTTKNLGDSVEICIRDNGSGIPEEIHNKIFNPFFSTKPAGEGTGLGLSIAYDIIVKEHNGQISFDTREGEFTEFTISLPGEDPGRLK